jgi:hypothetical protein
MCDTFHEVGSCPLKLCGVEHCGLCGYAHFAGASECPHLNSETQVRLMLIALKESTEDKELVDAATAYLRGRKGTLVRSKKEKAAKAAKAERVAAMVAAANAGKTSLSAAGKEASTGSFNALNRVAAGELHQMTPSTLAIPSITNDKNTMNHD